MDRLISIGLFLLALVMAALFYNIGFIINPEIGVFDSAFYSEEGLRIVFFTFMTASGVSVFIGFLALGGSIWLSKAKLLSSISIFSLTIVGGVTWWKYSALIYVVG
jgi:hypothetical protein